MYTRSKYHGKSSAGQHGFVIAGRITACFSFFMIVLAFSAGSAWSFEITGLQGSSTSQISEKFSFSSTSSSMADPCLLLLKSVHSTPTTSAMDRSRHSAGQAAQPLALGFVFGVHYALTPPGTSKTRKSGKLSPRLDIWQTLSPSGSRRALAVADYRSCQKKKALKALEQFRWAR